MFQDARSARSDTATGGDEYKATEERDDAEDSERWDTPDPKLRRGILDHIYGPISGARDHERVPGLSWHRDGCERMPLEKRAARNSGERTRNGSDCRNEGELRW